MNWLMISIKPHKYLPITVFIFVIIIGPAMAQERSRKWGIGLSSGLATFSMQDLQKYLAERQTDEFPDARIVKAFPSYFVTSLHATYADNQKFFDLSVGRTSTGGRISYSDYSGRYSHDITAVMGYSNVSAGFRVATIGKVDILMGFQILLYSNVMIEKISETIYGANSYSYKLEYSSMNLAIAPGLNFHRHIGPRFLLRQQTSYEVHIPSPLIDASNEKLTNKSGESVLVQGQGLRLRLGIVYMF
jgi:hypothetical protein